jgi:hypothetical protein
MHCFMCLYSIVAAAYTATVMNEECTVVTEFSGGHLYSSL